VASDKYRPAGALTDLEIDMLHEFAAGNPDKFTFGYDPERGGYMFYLHGDLHGCTHPKQVVNFLLANFGSEPCSV
jgi:hypothetical protein